jgi:hypothetical protein
VGPTRPHVDPAARQRLSARFGSEVDAWFDELPDLLTDLAKRWQLEFGSPIPRGTASAVFHCRMTDGRRAVLKASPDLSRLALEAAALTAWHTDHAPAVIDSTRIRRPSPESRMVSWTAEQRGRDNHLPDCAFYQGVSFAR